jgi:hypothetical protein
VTTFFGGARLLYELRILSKLPAFVNLDAVLDRYACRAAGLSHR